MAILKLSAPWEIYYKELNELFKQDEEVHIIYDRDDQIINIYVENEAKADAMYTALPQVKEFGGVTLEINVVPANKTNLRRSRGTTYEDLFYKNPIVNDIVTIDGIMSNPITYIIFEKEVVQYYNDNLGDANGLCSTLYQDIAKRIFCEEDGVFFCTDKNIKLPAFSIPSYTLTTASNASNTCKCNC